MTIYKRYEDEGEIIMGLMCPNCSKKEFTLVKMYPAKGYTRKSQRGLYRCSTCGYQEVIG